MSDLSLSHMQCPSFSLFIAKQSFECGTPRFGKPLFYTLFLIFNVVGKVLRPVLLAGRETEQRQFRGQRDLEYSAPRVWWLRTPLRGKAKVQGARPSKPEKKGTCLIGNSRGIAIQVQTTSIGFGQDVGHLPVSVT